MALARPDHTSRQDSRLKSWQSHWCQDTTDSIVGISGEKGDQKLIIPVLENCAVECTVLAIKYFFSPWYEQTRHKEPLMFLFRCLHTTCYMNKETTTLVLPSYLQNTTLWSQQSLSQVIRYTEISLGLQPGDAF